MKENQSHSGSHLLDGTLLVFLSEILIIPTGFITAAFLSRNLRPEGYGLFVLASSIVGWIEYNIGSFFCRPGIHFIGKSPSWEPVARTLLRGNLAAGLGYALVLWFGAEAVANWFHEPRLVSILRIYALDIPLFALVLGYRTILMGVGHFRQRALASTIRWCSRLVLVLLLVGLGLSVQGAILACIGASVAELLVTSRRVRLSWSGEALSFGIFVKYAGPLFIAAISFQLFEKVDLFLYKRLVADAAQAGLYGAAQNGAMVFTLFSMSFSPLILSEMMQALRKGGESPHEVAVQSVRIGLLLFPFACLISGSARDLMTLVYGSRFLEGAPFLSILIFGSQSMLMISLITALLTGIGRLDAVLWLTLPILPVGIAGHCLLIPKWGGIGAAAVMTVCALAAAAAGCILVSRIWKLHLFRLLLHVSVLGVAAFFAARLETQGLFSAIKIGILTTVLFLLMRITSLLTKEDVAIVRSLFHQECKDHKNPERG